MADHTWKMVPLTEDLLQGVVDALRDSFFTDEQVCRCVNLLEDSPVVVSNSKYKCTVASTHLENLAIDSAKDGVSLAVVDLETNEVVGAAFNKLQVKPPLGELSYFEKYAEEHIKDHSATVLVNFMVEVDSKKDLFEHFNTDCGLELMFLVVKNSAKGRRIGQALVEGTIRVAKEYNKTPKPGFVSSIFTSKFSQRCGERAGMETMTQIPYTEFVYNNRKFSEVTGPEHPFARVCALKI